MSCIEVFDDRGGADIDQLAPNDVSVDGFKCRTMCRGT